MKKLKYILLALLLALLTTGCSKNIKTETRGDASAKVKILLASKKSEYKTALITDLTAKMEKLGYYIKITGLNKLKKEKIEEYNALIILNDCEMGNLTLTVAKYLSKLEESENSKVILFTTAGSPEEWAPDLDVHAITTASEESNIPQMSTQILARVALLAR